MGKIIDNDTRFLAELGRRIGKIRKERGITQVELGFRIDMEGPNVNRLEKGGTNPTILTLKKVCAALEVDLEDLLAGLGKHSE